MSEISFGERLKQLRLSAGMTQSELGRYLGIGKTAISNYETGASYPDMLKLIDIATLFHISMDYLLGMKDKNKERPGDTLREDSDATYRFVSQIPILDDVTDGLPKYLVTQAVDFIILSPPMDNVSEFFGLKVQDHSMDRTRILKGDTVLIHRQPFAESGETVLAMVEGEGPVIRKYILSDKRVHLLAHSTDQNCKSWHFRPGDPQLQILGKVLYVIIAI